MGIWDNVLRSGDPAKQKAGEKQFPESNSGDDVAMKKLHSRLETVLQPNEKSMGREELVQAGVELWHPSEFPKGVTTQTADYSKAHSEHGLALPTHVRLDQFGLPRDNFVIKNGNTTYRHAFTRIGQGPIVRRMEVAVDESGNIRGTQINHYDDNGRLTGYAAYIGTDITAPSREARYTYATDGSLQKTETTEFLDGKSDTITTEYRKVAEQKGGKQWEIRQQRNGGDASVSTEWYANWTTEMKVNPHGKVAPEYHPQTDYPTPPLPNLDTFLREDLKPRGQQTAA